MATSIHHTLRLTASLLTATLLLLAAQSHAQSVAMITDVTGKAVISGGAKPAAAAILAELSASARVQLDAGARVNVLLLQSGDEYVLEGPSLISFAAREPAALSGNAPRKLANTPRAGEVRITRAPVTQAAVVMRSFRAGTRIRLLNLRGTRTLAAAPEFRWASDEAATRYTFELSDDTGKSLYQTETGATTLRLPASVKLGDGAGYTWEVSARLSDGRRYISYGDFSVVAADLRTRVEAARPAPDASVSDRVVFAAWLDQMELRDEARGYWRALAQERPEDEALKRLAGE